MAEPKHRPQREPTPWELAPKSSGFTFEGSVDRIRFLSGKGAENARHTRTRLTVGFKLVLFFGVAVVIFLAAVLPR